MPAPRVSVLMTAYNREKYIATAIESVLASSFADFELIIVDDCSRDKTVGIAKRYTADPRVQVHQNPQNLGDYPNRNAAAALAAGTFLKYVDADDYIYPHGLGLMVETMQHFPTAAVGFASLAQDRMRPFPFQLTPAEVYRRHYFETPVFHKAPLSTIIRGDAFRAVGGFSGKRWVGDCELWHLLTARYPAVLMPHGLVWWREHEEQESANNRKYESVLFEFLLVAEEQLLKAECPLTGAEKARALGLVKRQQARMIGRQFIRGRPRVGLQLFHRSAMTVGGLLTKALVPLAGPGTGLESAPLRPHGDKESA